MSDVGPFDLSALTGFVRRLLEAAGASGHDAAIVARHVVDAEARENRSQGLIRVPPYVRWAREGAIVSPTRVTVVRDGAAALVLDAGSGWGHVAAHQAMEHCLRRAGETGVCVAVVRNMNHMGRLGAYVEEAAGRGMIGAIMCSGNPDSAWVAPWGGLVPLFGTNPIAIGIPRDGAPVVVDISTTQGSRGAVLMAQVEGTAIPEDWAFDREGRPTTDPHRALPPAGTLAPLGGHKGYALAVAVEILCGVLSGPWPPPVSSALVAALRVDAFLPLDAFTRSLADLERAIKAGPTRPGFDEIRLPGEGSASRRRRAETAGVRVAERLWRELVALGRELRVEPPEPERRA
jgi:LDH2 family malate/lactate/ureidoglycolate dehydrogenase